MSEPRPSPSLEEAIADAVRAAILQGGSRRPVYVQVLYNDGRTVTVPLPHVRVRRPKPAPAAPAPHPEGGCRADILRALREAGHRLTTTELLSELARRGCEWSERKVQDDLARMVEEGVIDNRQDTRPRGYGFTSTA